MKLAASFLAITSLFTAKAVDGSLMRKYNRGRRLEEVAIDLVRANASIKAMRIHS